MYIPPYALCWIDGLCHWLELSPAGIIVRRSDRGFPTEEGALADFKWRYAT